MASKGAVRKTNPVREAPGRHRILRHGIAFFLWRVMPSYNHLIQRSGCEPDPRGGNALKEIIRSLEVSSASGASPDFIHKPQRRYAYVLQ